MCIPETRRNRAGPIDSGLFRLADTGETCTLQSLPPSGTEIYALARS
jgi:hypothetical protein